MLDDRTFKQLCCLSEPIFVKSEKKYKINEIKEKSCDVFIGMLIQLTDFYLAKSNKTNTLCHTYLYRKGLETMTTWYN